MSHKVKPSQVLSKTIQDLIQGQQGSEDLLTDLLRLGAQHILQQATEAEVDEFLGRGWYERGLPKESQRGYRNGYTPVNFKTTQGPITLQRPRVRDTDEPYHSALLSRIDRLEDRLVKLATEMYVRGLSTRDIEQTLVDEQGGPILSRSVTSRLTDQLYAEYEHWSTQDLSGYDGVSICRWGV